ncbi:hypothetical protein HRbin08_00838 [bacterium HR08]|nr:hypothetical protein HRbin08_00838 [bacterium HR08]
MRCRVAKLVVCAGVLGGVLALRGDETEAQRGSARFGERPALERHLEQAEIEGGRITLDELLQAGERIFAARCPTS